MKVMWHLVKGERHHIVDAVVFEEEDLEAFLEDGFEVEGKFELTLVEGKEALPDIIEGS